MSASVKVVPKDDWIVLEKYLASAGVILIPAEVYAQLPAEAQATADRGFDEHYDFGGDPDVFVEKMTAIDHYWVDCQLRDNEGEK